MIGLAKLSSEAATGADLLPATTRLRAGLLMAADGETLVSLFAGALAEHGIAGHFCVRRVGGRQSPILGDAPDLISKHDQCLVIDTPEARVLLADSTRRLSAPEQARIRGFAALYAARALALQELADDVETACGLSLRERYVLGRCLAGLAPVDIAIETGLSVATVSAAMDASVERLQATDLAAAIAFAARRGWLAVTNLQNCSSSSENTTYKATKNG